MRRPPPAADISWPIRQPQPTRAVPADHAAATRRYPHRLPAGRIASGIDNEPGTYRDRSAPLPPTGPSPGPPAGCGPPPRARSIRRDKRAPAFGERNVARLLFCDLSQFGESLLAGNQTEPGCAVHRQGATRLAPAWFGSSFSTASACCRALAVDTLFQQEFRQTSPRSSRSGATPTAR